MDLHTLLIPPLACYQKVLCKNRIACNGKLTTQLCHSHKTIQELLMLRSTSRVALRLAQSSKVAVRAFGSNNIAFVATPLFKPTRVLAQEDFRERAPRVITEEIARRRVQIGNVTEDTKWYNIKEFFESMSKM
jgi:hypothetical protein